MNHKKSHNVGCNKIFHNNLSEPARKERKRVFNLKHLKWENVWQWNGSFRAETQIVVWRFMFASFDEMNVRKAKISWESLHKSCAIDAC